MKSVSRRSLTLLLTLLSAGIGRADSNQWRNAGPETLGVGGFLAFDPQDANTLYTGASTGLFKSTDGGATWNNAGLIGRPVASLAIDPQNPSTLYAVTSTSNVFRSTDGGATWNEADSGLPTPQPYVRLLRIAPQNTATLYALVGDSLASVFKTTDAGANWTPVSGLPGAPFIVDVAVDPQDSNTLYVAAMGQDITGRPAVGLFKSRDGGSTWNKQDWLPDAGNGINISLFVPRGAITIDQKNPNTIYVTRSGIGVYKSTDGGASWRAANSGLPNLVGEYEFMSCCASGVIIDARNSNTLYALGSFYAVIFKSTDGGANWRQASMLGGGVTQGPLTIDPHNGALFTPPVYGGKVMLKSVDGAAPWDVVFFSPRDTPVSTLAVAAGTLYAGAFTSGDSGVTWSPTNMPFASSLAALAIDPQTPSTMYAGTSVTTVDDDGDTVPCSLSSASGIFKSVDGGANWLDTQVGFGCISTIVVDPQSPSTVYAGSQHNGVYKSTDGGTSWAAANSGLPGGPLGVAVNTVAVDPKSTSTLYASTASGLFKSVDGAATWSDAGLSPVTYALAIDPQNTGTLYAATASGLFRSVDGGASWRNLFPSTMTSVYAVVIHPQNSSTIYAGSDDGVAESIDGGESWTLIPGGPAFVRLLALDDPKAPGTLYAGGPGGLFAIGLGPAGRSANRAR